VDLHIAATSWTADDEYVLKEPFEPSIQLTKDGLVPSGVYIKRKIAVSTPTSGTSVTHQGNEQGIEQEFGTRATETDSLVYHVLRVPEYRIESVLVRFLEAAFAVMLSPEQVRIHGERKLHTPDIIRKRARKLLARMAQYGESAVPKNVLDLIAWSELSVNEQAQPVEAISTRDAKAGRKARRTTRHFKNCKQCDIRFLAKRADQDFHSAKCGLRWRRSHPDDRRNCTEPLGAIENTEVKQGVFVVPPVLAVSGIEQVSGQNP
jgi:hypothetical protein